LWGALPSLRSLVLNGGLGSLGTIEAEQLEELVVSFATRHVVDAIGKAAWPALRWLTLTLTMPTSELGGALVPLFESTTMPCLESLTLKRWLTGDHSLPIPQDALVVQATRFAATRRLTHLELEMPLTVNGARELIALANVGEPRMPPLSMPV